MIEFTTAFFVSKHKGTAMKDISVNSLGEVFWGDELVATFAGLFDPNNRVSVV